MSRSRTPVVRERRRRHYSSSTLKLLFGLSGNQCAHPDCSYAVIEAGTEHSDDRVTAHICHINAISETGPRAKPELTQEQLNAPENLILLCAHHHAVVDAQHESYPAELLLKWKREHEKKYRRRYSADSKSVGSGAFSPRYFPRALVDEEINREVETLRKSRLFEEFDRVNSALAFGRRVAGHELSGGSDDVRFRALAWCARLLSRSEEVEKAQEMLGLARALGSGQEVDIAQAFIDSEQGDRAGSLQVLAALDTPSSRSAALMVVVHHDGGEGGIGWMTETGTSAADLDSDGKSFLLVNQLKLGHWEEGLETLGAIPEQDFENTPILWHLAGMAKLLSVVPAEFHATVLNYVPFNVVGFPVGSDAIAMEARSDSHAYFVRAAEAARQLECGRAAKINNEYALWLELKDPAQSAKGKRRLESMLRDPKSALSVVHRALELGIRLDVAKVERDIEREIARNGGVTFDAAFARFAIAFSQKTPERVAQYLDRHHDQLATQIDKKALLFRQVEMSARAGLSDKAKRFLDQLIEDGVSEAEENRLRNLIAQAQGQDPIGGRKQQFDATGSLTDLMNLVLELEARGNWDDASEYGKRLFERTGSLEDAERLARALNNAHRSKALVEFLDANRYLMSQSIGLKLCYARGLFDEGALVESRAVLAELCIESESTHTRALRVDLAIALGDLGSISAFVAEEYQRREERTAHELMRAGQLALIVDSPHLRALVSTAAQSANDDADILAGAYVLASRAGWDEDEDVARWLYEAAELSDEGGPLQRVSLGEVLDTKRELDRRGSDTWRLLARGAIPMFVAARSLNRSLADLTIFPALANCWQSDPRRRSAIPAYSGKRRPQKLQTAGKTIGLDGTALLTLSFLNLLDKALDTFESVCIPHTTLAWLFEERQRARFHQPSRIRNAHRVRDLLSRGVLEEFVARTVPDSELCTQVGDELAALIAEAEKVNSADSQRIVVCSGPAYRLSTLMEEEADLSSHAAVLSSCFAVVKKLREKGQVTAKEENRARAYLQFHERPWPNQPRILDGAILYLDDRAITYLLHLGMLEKLRNAGLRAVASPREIFEANALIAYERTSEGAIRVLERIGTTLNARIESGKVKVDRRRKYEEGTEELIGEHPTVGLFALASRCDAIIADDRLINQHTHVEDGDRQVPIFTTLDLLDALESGEVISNEDRLECRTLLRRAGYLFVPVEEDELGRYLTASPVQDHRTVETAELKAIRESVLRVRMSDWLQFPEEGPWLDGILMGFVRVLRGLWKDGSDIGEVQARSAWIAQQIDARGWAHTMGPERGDEFVRMGRGAHVLLLLTSPSDAGAETTDAYWNWVQDGILVPLKEQFPDIYGWILEWNGRQVSEIARTEMSEAGPS